MKRRAGFLLVVGLAGVAALASLGVWQIQRLAWKEAKLADIAAGMASPLASLPDLPEELRDEYRAVTLTGRIGGPELHVLTSRSGDGPGYRVVTAMALAEGRRILIDRGFIPETEKTVPRPGGDRVVEGNLLWPDDVTVYTPAPNLDRNIWFGRSVPEMAATLGTEPVLLVARSPTGDGVAPMPVTVNIPNDHLGYALTWFGLAIVWAAMTAYVMTGKRQRPTRAG